MQVGAALVSVLTMGGLVVLQFVRDLERMLALPLGPRWRALDLTSLELRAAGGASRRERAKCRLRLAAKARWVHSDPLRLTATSSPSWLSTFGEKPGVDDSNLRRVLALGPP